MLYYALAKSDKVCQTVKPCVSAKTNNVVNFHPRYDQLVAKECLLRATFIRFSYYTYIFSTHTTPTPLLKLIEVNQKAVTCKLTELNHTAPITQQCMVQHQPTPVTSAENKCGAGGDTWVYNMVASLYHVRDALVDAGGAVQRAAQQLPEAAHVIALHTVLHQTGPDAAPARHARVHSQRHQLSHGPAQPS